MSLTLLETLNWIPAFAGMTGGAIINYNWYNNNNSNDRNRRVGVLIKGENVERSTFNIQLRMRNPGRPGGCFWFSAGIVFV